MGLAGVICACVVFHISFELIVEIHAESKCNSTILQLAKLRLDDTGQIWFQVNFDFSLFDIHYHILA